MMPSPKIALALGAAGVAVLGIGAYTTSTRQQVIRAARRVVPFKREHATNKLVTQGRAVWAKYSGCGDLWNYVLDVIGAPSAWVNRDSPRRGVKWKEQVNIGQPWHEALKAGARAKFKKGGPWPKAGDLVLIGQEPEELAHVFVVLKRLGPRHYRTAEYGGASNASSLGERRFDENGLSLGKWQRHLVGWIDADKIPTESRWRPGRVRSILGITIPERQAA